VLSRLWLLLKCLICWWYWPQGSIKFADCIVALSFGRGNNTSGDTNAVIACRIIQLLEKGANLPIIAQWWTRDPFRWFIKELGVRFYCWQNDLI